MHGEKIRQSFWGAWKLTGLDEPSSGLFTLVMKKMPEGWRIVHDPHLQIG